MPPTTEAAIRDVLAGINGPEMDRVREQRKAAPGLRIALVEAARAYVANMLCTQGPAEVVRIAISTQEGTTLALDVHPGWRPMTREEIEEANRR